MRNLTGLAISAKSSHFPGIYSIICREYHYRGLLSAEMYSSAILWLSSSREKTQNYSNAHELLARCWMMSCIERAGLVSELQNEAIYQQCMLAIANFGNFSDHWTPSRSGFGYLVSLMRMTPEEVYNQAGFDHAGEILPTLLDQASSIYTEESLAKHWRVESKEPTMESSVASTVALTSSSVFPSILALTAALYRVYQNSNRYKTSVRSVEEILSAPNSNKAAMRQTLQLHLNTLSIRVLSGLLRELDVVARNSLEPVSRRTLTEAILHWAFEDPEQILIRFVRIFLLSNTSENQGSSLSSS